MTQSAADRQANKYTSLQRAFNQAVETITDILKILDDNNIDISDEVRERVNCCLQNAIKELDFDKKKLEKLENKPFTNEELDTNLKKLLGKYSS